MDVKTLQEPLSLFWKLIWGTLTLNPQAYVAAQTNQVGPQLTTAVLLLGGISLTLGQSGVLFANRVSRRRFILGVLTSAMTIAISVLFWAASIWLIAALVFRLEEPFIRVLIIVGLSYAPLLFGFLVLLPYLGYLLSQLLPIWIFLGTLTAVRVTFGFDLWQALACTFLGWLLLELVERVPILKIDSVDRWVWRLSTGTPVQLNTLDAVEEYVRRSRSSFEQALRRRTRDR